MAEVVTGPLPRPPGIYYTDKQLGDMSQRYSRLKPVEPGDVCCNCGGDCDGDGFAWQNFTARRVNGHPLCARVKCLAAQMNEFSGQRSGCGCGLRREKRTGGEGVK